MNGQLRHCQAAHWGDRFCETIIWWQPYSVCHSSSMVFSFLAIILNETILSCVCWPFSVKQKRPQHPAESLWFTWEVLSGPLLKWEVLMKGLHFEVLWGLGYIYDIHCIIPSEHCEVSRSFFVARLWQTVQGNLAACQGGTVGTSQNLTYPKHGMGGMGYCQLTGYQNVTHTRSPFLLCHWGGKCPKQ